ncbi:MAG: HDOD domain-containing protein [bacterium]
MNPLIEKQLLNIRDLPTLPTVIVKLTQAVDDPNTDARRIANLLQDDPALSARVLRLVNSVLYAGSEPIISVQMAASRIGMAGVRNLAIAAAVFQSFRPSPKDAFDRNEFWRHCILCGVASTVLFRRVRGKIKRFYPDDILHLSGLVHDIGRIVLDVYFHDAFVAAMTVSRQSMFPLVDMERKHIGTDHAEVGAWLARRWKMAPAIEQTIRWHHEPDSATPEHQELAVLCNVANYICNFQQLGWSGDSSPVFLPALWERIGLTPNDAHAIGESIQAEGRDSQLLAALG